MKKTSIIFLFISILLISKVFSQDKVLIINNNSYPAIELHFDYYDEWIKVEHIYGNEYKIPAELVVSIAKGTNRAYIALTVSGEYYSVPDYKPIVMGNISIILDDYSIISCIDRKIYDTEYLTSTTFYYLTFNELNKLKNHNILKIKFNVFPCRNCLSETYVAAEPQNEFINTKEIINNFFN